MTSLPPRVLRSLVLVPLAACQDRDTPPSTQPEPDYAALREQMVRRQIEGRGITDPRVLDAMRAVPRHEFVDPDSRRHAYADHPLDIACGQTISQPYVVALMTQELGLPAGARVLEIGTGSGYQAAVLAQLGLRVFSIELEGKLAESALATLHKVGLAAAVNVRVGDGYRGWPEAAPFDGILVTAAPDHVPEPLYEQLKMGGRMVIPVGDTRQELLVIEKTPQGRRQRTVGGVLFVPMRGEAEGKR